MRRGSELGAVTKSGGRGMMHDASMMEKASYTAYYTSSYNAGSLIRGFQGKPLWPSRRTKTSLDSIPDSVMPILTPS